MDERLIRERAEHVFQRLIDPDLPEFHPAFETYVAALREKVTALRIGEASSDEILFPAMAVFDCLGAMVSQKKLPQLEAVCIAHRELSSALLVSAGRARAYIEKRLNGVENCLKEYEIEQG